MKKKLNIGTLIGFAGLALGAIATAISNYAQEKQMEEIIEEKVNKALAEREETEEESY